MTMYCGIDLHSNNSYVAILDEDFNDVVSRRLRNELEVVLEVLEPYRSEIESIGVESTYNWYWLVDGLMASGYDVRLVNTTKAADYSGLKYTDDKHDARWIAHLLVLGILPEGYIMPPGERSLRDLLRRRMVMVQKRTALQLSIRTQYCRSTGKQKSAKEIREMGREAIASAVGDELVAESIAVVFPVINALTRQIKEVEKTVLKKAKLRDEFGLLRSAPGLGVISALTIMCETGDIGRFPKVGNYASYCRCVKSERRSNNKFKGKGNRKNGNKYLSWAYSEVAIHAVRFEPLAKRWMDRKKKRCHPMVANRALANKMARACFYVMRDQVRFDRHRVFR